MPSELCTIYLDPQPLGFGDRVSLCGSGCPQIFGPPASILGYKNSKYGPPYLAKKSIVLNINAWFIQ